MSTLAVSYHYPRKERAPRYQGLVVVVVLHLAVGYVLLTGLARKGLDIIKKPLEAVVIQEVIIPPPPPPPPQKLEKPPAQAAKIDAPPPPFVPPAEVVAPSSTAPVIAAVATPPPTPVVIAPAPAPPAPVAKPAEPPAVNLEAEYVGRVRAMLNSTKRYPTGREASQSRPQGKVKVWFTLSRSGALIDAGILEASNSHLLDSAALATVRRGAFPAFPASAWTGQDQNKFSAEIEFNPPSTQ